MDPSVDHFSDRYEKICRETTPVKANTQKTVHRNAVVVVQNTNLISNTSEPKKFLLDFICSLVSFGAFYTKN
jgi:hypothetical protein